MTSLSDIKKELLALGKRNDASLTRRFLAASIGIGVPKDCVSAFDTFGMHGVIRVLTNGDFLDGLDALNREGYSLVQGTLRLNPEKREFEKIGQSTGEEIFPRAEFLILLEHLKHDIADANTKSAFRLPHALGTLGDWFTRRQSRQRGDAFKIK